MTIRSAYRESLRHEGHVRDPAQELVVDRLAGLQADLVKDMNPLRRETSEYIAKVTKYACGPTRLY